MNLYTSFSIYVTYVITLGRRQKHKKENRWNFYKNVVSNLLLRGGIKTEKEGRLAGFMFLCIAPYLIVDLPLTFSK
jgi:hypothetical protein